MSPSSSSDRPRKTPRAKSATSTKSAKAAKTSSSQNRDRTERASRVTARQLRSRDAASLADRESASSGGGSTAAGTPEGKRASTVADGLSGLGEQLINRILEPLGLVVLSREGIAQTVSAAADRGRLTYSDAESLANELVQLGREQTEELRSDRERTLGRGRQQLGGAKRRARLATPDRIMRHADRARRSIGVGPAFPILGYEDLTVAQVLQRLGHLSDPQLRKVRDYERRNAGRKSLLRAIEKALG